MSDAVSALVLWVKSLRPRADEPATRRIDAWLARDDPSTVQALNTVLQTARSAEDLASEGILDDQPLLPAVMRRVARKVLPELRDDDTLHAAVDAIFDPDDAEWLAQVPTDRWAALLRRLDVDQDPDHVPEALSLAMQVIAHRIAALGLKPVLLERVPELGLEGSPFLTLSDQVLAVLRRSSDGIAENEAECFERCHRTLAACRDAVDELRAQKHRFGTSLELTALSFRMVGLVDRLDQLLNLLEPDHQADAAKRLTLDLVRSEAQRTQVLPLVRRHGDLLLFQVVEHAARKGRNYIAVDAEAWWSFLRSSLLGGVFVAVFALIKMKLSSLPLSLGGEALVYSLDYGICFILLYLAGGTLATKQPAVTAHTLAHALEREGQRDPEGLAQTVAALVRSQLASVVGNVAMALPLAWLLAFGWQALTGEPLVDVKKATVLLESVEPTVATAWFAAVAGVYLFSAGLIGGWVDNRLLYDRIPDRIAAHPRLLAWIGPQRARQLADALAAKAGGIAGNALLGVALGATGVLGIILGVPLDIRHIAFGSANLAVGLHTLGPPPWEQVAALSAGVALIGAVNLLVSFGLAMVMAAESRGLSLREDGRMVAAIALLALRQPLRFVVPPRTVSTSPAGLEP